MANVNDYEEDFEPDETTTPMPWVNVPLEVQREIDQQLSQYVHDFIDDFDRFLEGGQSQDGKLDFTRESSDMPGVDPRHQTDQPDARVERPVDLPATDSRPRNSRKPRPTHKIRREM